MTKKFIGFAGTYTRESSKGIYRFELDTAEKVLQKVDVAAEIGSPTYLTLSEDQQTLYAVDQKGEQGGVAAYRVDQTTGELTFLNEQLVDGAPPCHVTISGTELLAGNYHKGTVDVLEVSSEGINTHVATATHEGSGPHERQDSPHVHYTARTPDDKYIIIADLGTDELVTYQLKDNTLVKVSTFDAKPGSGPRHIDFHPNGKTAYLLTELSSEVIVLNYNSETGEFTEEQTISALPADFAGDNDASAIYVTSDGQYLYTGNRGHDSIAVFKIDAETHGLSLVEHTSTGGKFPRDFALDPSEAFLVAANQHSGNLVLFERDVTTGKLSQLDSTVDVPEAVCVAFLS